MEGGAVYDVTVLGLNSLGLYFMILLLEWFFLVDAIMEYMAWNYVSIGISWN